MKEEVKVQLEPIVERFEDDVAMLVSGNDKTFRINLFCTNLNTDPYDDGTPSWDMRETVHKEFSFNHATVRRGVMEYGGKKVLAFQVDLSEQTEVKEVESEMPDWYLGA